MSIKHKPSLYMYIKEYKLPCTFRHLSSKRTPFLVKSAKSSSFESLLTKTVSILQKAPNLLIPLSPCAKPQVAMCFSWRTSTMRQKIQRLLFFSASTSMLLLVCEPVIPSIQSALAGLVWTQSQFRRTAPRRNLNWPVRCKPYRLQLQWAAHL